LLFGVQLHAGRIAAFKTARHNRRLTVLLLNSSIGGSGAGKGKVVLASRSSAVQLAKYTQDARALDADTFADKHGVGFLLHFGTLDGSQKEVDLETTQVSEYTDEAPEAATPQQNFLVFPVRKKASDASDQAIWIGRGSHNDIVIPDGSISTMHAFVRVDEEGKFFIQDMMSKNGTFVYNQRVPALGTGEPMGFSTGDRIRIGTLKLTFLAAAEFITMVNQLG
jgi:hypothetical protein